MLILVGCNHRSAPIALRERLAFAEAEVEGALGRLLERDGIEEGLILSTCNRVEVLTRFGKRHDDGPETIKRYLCEERGIPPEQLEGHTYHLLGLDAVRHLFQVATGLDSMILGEPQVLGQVKQAHRVARRAGATGAVLERLLQQCFATAKRVRTDTGISRNATSVANAAVDLARKIFGRLTGRKAMLLGAGKMAELVARHLVSSGIGNVIVTSRTYHHAMVSAERFEGTPVHWSDGLSRLADVDIVISCTGSPRPILGKNEVEGILRARRGEPLFMIDIAVPRDIDPAVNELANVYLYDIDGLQEVVDANLEERRLAARRAQSEIERDVEGFKRWRQSLEITPTIVALREHLTGLGRDELERFRRRLEPLAPEQERALEELMRGFIQKVLHRPVVHLRKSVERGDVDASAALYRKLFGLQSTEEKRKQAPARQDEPRSRDDLPPSGPRRVLKGGKD